MEKYIASFNHRKRMKGEIKQADPSQACRQARFVLLSFPLLLYLKVR